MKTGVVSMIFVEAVFALGIAFFFTIIFIALGRGAGSWKRVIVFFSFIFLAAWAGGIWITPVGPAVLGVYWLSFFVVGLVFALFREALAAASKTVVPPEKMKEIELGQERELERVFNVFSFVLLVVFIVIIVVGYLFRRR
jgi:hypothetical protein